MSCHSEVILPSYCANATVVIRGTALDGFGRKVPNNAESFVITENANSYCLTLEFVLFYQGENYYFGRINGQRTGAGYLADIHIESVVCNTPGVTPYQCENRGLVPLNPCEGVHSITVSGTALSNQGQFEVAAANWQLTGRHINFVYEVKKHPFGSYQGFQLYQPFINGTAITVAGFKCGVEVTNISTVCEPDCSDCCALLLPIARGIQL